ncbi:hypothetical protein, partial [Salmonella sp. s54395]|uniref:hypothetical protein n=1 Tax=Salmonella sp. s54395 TaxID=3159664 RepID=UPI0039813747
STSCLFIIYLNDICHVSEIVNIILFDDDTNISFESNAIVNWFAANKVSLNIDKTNYIAFNTSRTFNWDTDIIMGGKILKQVYTTKFLGVHIDHKL